MNYVLQWNWNIKINLIKTLHETVLIVVLKRFCCYDSMIRRLRHLEKLYDEGEISPLAIIADSSSNGMVNAIYPSD